VDKNGSSPSLDPADFLDLANQLIRKISDPKLEIESLCQFLALKTLSFLDPSSIYINKLCRDGKVRTITTFGLENSVKESWSDYSIGENLPSNDAMRSDKMIWLADQNDWEENYPELARYENDKNANTFIGIPIDVPGSAVGSIGIMSKKKIAQSYEVTSFLWIVGSLVTLSLVNSQTEQDVEESLTRRQIEILEFLGQEYSNREISRELGFSESTIRHETMKIYQVLNVTGRKEAVQAAIAQNLIKPNFSDANN
jgi:DNA-binding CsgD family transcriptional regulator